MSRTKFLVQIVRGFLIPEKKTTWTIEHSFEQIKKHPLLFTFLLLLDLHSLFIFPSPLSYHSFDPSKTAFRAVESL